MWSLGRPHQRHLGTCQKRRFSSPSDLLTQKSARECGVGRRPICFNKPSRLFCHALYSENHWLWDNLKFLPENLPFLEKNSTCSLLRDELFYNASQPTKAPYCTVVSCDPYRSGSREVLIFQPCSQRYRGSFKGVPTSALDREPRTFFLHTAPLEKGPFCVLMNKYEEMIFVFLMGLREKL